MMTAAVSDDGSNGGRVARAATDMYAAARGISALQPPLVAILRGVELTRAADVGAALFDAGFRVIEVPLNRPNALEAITAIARIAPADAVIGAGTVMRPIEVDAIAQAGGQLIVTPHLDIDLVAYARSRGMLVAPGVFTASECFAALRAGAHALKLFPADVLSPGGLRALATVLPPGTHVWPVGGVTPESMPGWLQAGATGFGIGGALFQPGRELVDIVDRAHAYLRAWKTFLANRQAQALEHDE